MSRRANRPSGRARVGGVAAAATHLVVGPAVAVGAALLISHDPLDEAQHVERGLLGHRLLQLLSSVTAARQVGDLGQVDARALGHQGKRALGHQGARVSERQV